MRRQTTNLGPAQLVCIALQLEGVVASLQGGHLVLQLCRARLGLSQLRFERLLAPRRCHQLAFLHLHRLLKVGLLLCHLPLKASHNRLHECWGEAGERAGGGASD